MIGAIEIKGYEIIKYNQTLKGQFFQLPPPWGKKNVGISRRSKWRIRNELEGQKM